MASGTAQPPWVEVVSLLSDSSESDTVQDNPTNNSNQTDSNDDNKNNDNKTDKTLIKCDFCEFKSKWRESVQRHAKRVHKKQFQQDKNNNNNDTEEEEETEDEDDIDEKQFNCNICTFKTKWRFCLTRHNKIHSNNEEFKCNICKFTSKWKHCLARHIKIHNKTYENPYQCKYCSVSFKNVSNLEKHTKIHLKKLKKIKNNKNDNSNSENKQFECNMCSFKTNWNHCLKRHYRVHSGEKPYQCNVCNKRFSQNHSLKIHIITHNKANKQKQLNKHMDNNNNNNIWHCEECNKYFYTQFAFAEHCSNKHAELIQNTKQIKQNVNVINQNQINNDILNKPLNLNEYIKVHSRNNNNIGPFIPLTQHKCQQCNQVFVTEIRLLYHVNVQHK